MPLFDEDKISEKWGAEVAKASLKAEMTKRGLSYQKLVEVLAKAGIEENERNLRNKVSRGTFTAAFYFQCLLAMGVRTVDFSHYYDAPDDLLKSIRAILDEDQKP